MANAGTQYFSAHKAPRPPTSEPFPHTQQTPYSVSGDEHLPSLIAEQAEQRETPMSGRQRGAQPRTRCHRSTLLSLLVALLLSAGQAHATTATLAADAHISTAQPAVNFGTLTNLAVGNGFTSLLQFDLSPLPTGTTAAQVSRATLRLFVNRADTPGLLSLSPITSTWGEYSVTSSSAPTLGASIARDAGLHRRPIHHHRRYKCRPGLDHGPRHQLRPRPHRRHRRPPVRLQGKRPHQPPRRARHHPRRVGLGRRRRPARPRQVPLVRRDPPARKAPPVSPAFSELLGRKVSPEPSALRGPPAS